MHVLGQYDHEQSRVEHEQDQGVFSLSPFHQKRVYYRWKHVLKYAATTFQKISGCVMSKRL